MDVDQHRAGGLERRLEITLQRVPLADVHAVHTEGAGESHEVRHAIEHVGGGITLLVEALLPLTHHALPVVVDDHHLHRKAIGRQGSQLLNVHQDAGVTRDAHHLTIGARHLGAHGGRHAEAHGSKTGTADPAPGPIAQVLGRPHLVLTHVRGDDGIRCQLANGQQHLLGEEGAFGGRHGEGIGLFPLGDARQPRSRAGLHLLLQAQLHQARHAQAQITQHRHIGATGLADFGRVNLKVDHPGPGGEGVELSGHPIVKTGANSNQQIAFGDGEVGIGRAVHAEHAHRERVVFIEGTLPHQGGGDRDLIALSDHPQAVVSTG